MLAVVLILFSCLFSLCLAVTAVMLGLGVVPAFTIYLTLGIAIPLFIFARRNTEARRNLATRFGSQGIV